MRIPNFATKESVLDLTGFSVPEDSGQIQDELEELAEIFGNKEMAFFPNTKTAVNALSLSHGLRVYSVADVLGRMIGGERKDVPDISRVFPVRPLDFDEFPSFLYSPSHVGGPDIAIFCSDEKIEGWTEPKERDLIGTLDIIHDVNSARKNIELLEDAIVKTFISSSNIRVVDGNYVPLTRSVVVNGVERVFAKAWLEKRGFLVDLRDVEGCQEFSREERNSLLTLCFPHTAHFKHVKNVWYILEELHRENGRRAI